MASIPATTEGTSQIRISTPPNLGTSLAVMSQATPSDRVRLVDLRETALDVSEVVDALGDASSGGLTLFIGRVRDHDRAADGSDSRTKDVLGLDYSAHPTALAKLREVCEQVAEQYDVHAVAAVHRVGSLDIGDAAVVVATTSAHRGTSFEASRALIDTLKAQVPVWKHQRFAGCTEEWVGSP